MHMCMLVTGRVCFGAHWCDGSVDRIGHMGIGTWHWHMGVRVHVGTLTSGV